MVIIQVVQVAVIVEAPLTCMISPPSLFIAIVPQDIYQVIVVVHQCSETIRYVSGCVGHLEQFKGISRYWINWSLDETSEFDGRIFVTFDLFWTYESACKLSRSALRLVADLDTVWLVVQIIEVGWGVVRVVATWHVGCIAGVDR